MDRSVIKQNKEAFDAWVENGRAVWARSVASELWVLVEPGWEYGRIYEKNDQYSKFRKAQRDGKNLQHLTESVWMTVYVMKFEGNPNNYRIEPEKWYNNIPEKGILCKCYGNASPIESAREGGYHYDVIVDISPNGGVFYGSLADWNVAIPITLKEAALLIYDKE